MKHFFPFLYGERDSTAAWILELGTGSINSSKSSTPKIWVKLAHAYTADTRLSSSSPPRALLESLGMRLNLGVEL